MHNAVKKLHSQRGASIIYALLVFLLCAFAGVAALVSAAANAGRYARLEQDQQRYLSASSAARMLKEELCGKTVVMTLRLRQIYEWWYVQDAAAPAGTDVKRLYARQIYEFCQKDALNNYTAVALQPLDGKYYSIPSAQVCEFHTYDADGKEIPDENSLAKKLLEGYVGLVFLNHDVPSFFYGQQNGEGYLTKPFGFTGSNFPDKYTFKPVITDVDPVNASSGTHQPVSSSGAQTLEMALTVTGDSTDPSFADRLGTVDVKFIASDDYRLHVEVSETYGEDKDLYTTVFELPATVTSNLETAMQTEDDTGNEPAVTSYGRRVTLNTVTVRVQWPSSGISVTRTR